MENRAVVNLKRLKSNAQKIKNCLPKNTLFCAVVKANAYGHGIVPCANALYPLADYFAVATLEEGEELRLSGIDKPILLLTPVYPQDIDRSITFGLTLSVENMSSARQIFKIAKRKNCVANIHIKFNTGMNRLGADNINEILELAKFAVNSEYLKLTGIYSHLGCPENSSIRHQAVQRFLQVKEIVKSLDDNVIAHLSSSGGFLVGEYHDMVRIGLLLYGYKPFNSGKVNVKPIMKVYAPIIKTRHLHPNEFCCYGDKRLKAEERVKLIRYGYADGLDRIKTSNDINNRCMDITAIKDKEIKNKNFVLYSDAEALAKEYKTISYEILCKWAIRAKKEYKK